MGKQDQLVPTHLKGEGWILGGDLAVI